MRFNTQSPSNTYANQNYTYDAQSITITASEQSRYIVTRHSERTWPTSGDTAVKEIWHNNGIWSQVPMTPNERSAIESFLVSIAGIYAQRSQNPLIVDWNAIRNPSNVISRALHTRLWVLLVHPEPHHTPSDLGRFVGQTLHQLHRHAATPAGVYIVSNGEQRDTWETEINRHTNGGDGVVLPIYCAATLDQLLVTVLCDLEGDANDCFLVSNGQFRGNISSTGHVEIETEDINKPLLRIPCKRADELFI